MNRYLLSSLVAIIAIACVLTGRAGTELVSAGDCESTAITEWTLSSGGNGHFYQGVCGDWITWDDAQVVSEAMGGNLVSITSAEEQDFVYVLIDVSGLWSDEGGGWCPGPLIGAIEPDGTAEPDGGWTWVTGEPFAYENWAGGEPNNNGGFDENRGAFGTGGCVGLQTSPEWHDIGEEDEHPSFVVEWDGPPPACEDTPVMEWPASAGGNGHFYQGICHGDIVEWDTANAAAQAAGGYLATPTSEEENEFVFDLIDSPGLWNLTSYGCIVGPWIGLFQAPGSQEPAGGWQWVTGEPFVYNNWGDDEPDNFDNDDAGVYFAGCPDLQNSLWVDLVSSELGEVIAYVVEWDENPATPSPTATPAPGEERTWGDDNCSGEADPIDSLLTLRFDAGLSTNTGDCPDMGDVVEVANASPHPWGDVDCGGDVNPIDSLKLLRFDAGLDVAQAAGCPEVGSGVTIVS